jgi:mono/diheme cytochrome c family protein
MLFNWVPNRIIYVSDPVRNAIVALTVGDDGKVFTVTAQRRIELPELSEPVDLAPVVPEIANPGFSSNTTLAGTSDIYAVNRGNGTVVRLTQEGKLVAVRRVVLGGEPLGPNRLNGIAVSRDAQRIFLTVSGGVPGHADKPGALIEIAAFGPGRSASVTPRVEHSELAQRGAVLFATAFTAEQGLGPLYNETSCGTCHAAPRLGGMAPDGLGLAMRVGAKSGDDYDPLERDGGPIARRHLIAGLSAECGLTAGIPAAANVISLRNAPALFGAGLIDQISDAAILEGADRQRRSGAAHGRAHIVSDGAGSQRVGRFGWKADTASLRQFVADAMRNELGLTNPLAPTDLVAAGNRCGQRSEPHDDGTILAALYAFVAELPPPAAVGSDDAEGQAMFTSVGCAVCHTPELAATGGVSVPLYSDLLLHDMGTTLDDGVVQGQARGGDWRTTPLWGLGDRIRYLHDGRADTLLAAIVAHDGEAAPATKAFLALPVQQRDQLLGFLRSL